MTICKKHPAEPAVGVCASCLRDRLLGLQSCVSPRSPNCAPSTSSVQQQGCGTRPPLFFSAGPPPPPPPPPPGKKAPGFSVLSTLFGTPGGGPSTSGERCCPPGDHTASAPQRPCQSAAGGGKPPSFSSWLAALFAVRCKRNRGPGGGRVGSNTRGASSAVSSAAASGIDEKVETRPAAAACQRRTCRFQRYRGMSPGSEPEEEEQQAHQQDGEEDRVASPSGSSGSASSSFEAHRALPGPTPARPFWRRDAMAVKTGFAVCFSPLVRPRPHHHRRARVVAGDSGGGAAHYTGDLQKPGVFRMRRQGQHHRLRQQHGGGGVKLCPNRSRKLVDLGRFR